MDTKHIVLIRLERSNHSKLRPGTREALLRRLLARTPPFWLPLWLHDGTAHKVGRHGAAKKKPLLLPRSSCIFCDISYRRRPLKEKKQQATGNDTEQYPKVPISRLGERPPLFRIRSTNATHHGGRWFGIFSAGAHALDESHKSLIDCEEYGDGRRSGG